MPLAGRWDTVSSKLLTECPWVSCAPSSVSARPVGPGHLLSCWPNRENQSRSSQRPSYSLLLKNWQEERLTDVLPVLRGWECCTRIVTHSPCLWPSHQSERKPGSGSVAKHEVQFHKLQLTERTQYKALCLSADGEIPVPSERSPTHAASVRCLTQEGSIFLQSYSLPEVYCRESLDNLFRRVPPLWTHAAAILASVCMQLRMKTKVMVKGFFFSRRSGFLLLWKNWYCSKTLESVVMQWDGPTPSRLKVVGIQPSDWQHPLGVVISLSIAPPCHVQHFISTGIKVQSYYPYNE